MEIHDHVILGQNLVLLYTLEDSHSDVIISGTSDAKYCLGGFSFFCVVHLCQCKLMQNTAKIVIVTHSFFNLCRLRRGELLLFLNNQRLELIKHGQRFKSSTLNPNSKRNLSDAAYHMGDKIRCFFCAGPNPPLPALAP